MARTIAALLVLAGVLWLQIFLSRAERRWPGLVLPLLAFLFSLLYPLNLVSPGGGVPAAFVMRLLLVWLLGNIPTVLLLAVYAACRPRAGAGR